MVAAAKRRRKKFKKKRKARKILFAFNLTFHLYHFFVSRLVVVDGFCFYFLFHMPKMQQKYKIDRTQRTLDAIAIENELRVGFFVRHLKVCSTWRHDGGRNEFQDGAIFRSRDTHACSRQIKNVFILQNMWYILLVLCGAADGELLSFLFSADSNIYSFSWTTR